MEYHLPDELLARNVAAGRVDDFEELLRRYRHRVYRICYGMAGNAEDAEDWAQECFVRAYQQLGRYNPDLPFAPWLLKVASNTCINLAKARTNRQERLEVGLDEERKDLSPCSDPVQATLAAEEARQVWGAVASLPPTLRQAVTLRVLEGLSYREMAETLGVPLQTASSRVRRALTHIRERLALRGNEVER